MILVDGVIVEILRPGTGDPMPLSEVGEVIVTSLTPDYPLIRVATGDLIAVLPGHLVCGRSNMDIKGWMGRADQIAKAKGMPIRPKQVARHACILPARVIIDRDGEADTLQVLLE